MKRVYFTLIFGLSFFMSFSQEKPNTPSHYIFPEFTQGTVLMKNGITYNTFLNYNSLSEEMIFENKDKRLAITKEELVLVDTIIIKDRKFFELNNIFVEKVNNSLIGLYAEHKCKLNVLGKPSAYGGRSQTDASMSASSFYSGGSFYELKLSDRYEVNPYTYYWLKKNGEMYRFINLRQLEKLYDNKKELFKSYVKTHVVKYDNEVSVVQLINFLESKR